MPLSNNEIIEKEIGNNLNLYKSILINITKKYDEDLLQDIYLILLDYDNDKLNECFNKKIIKYVFATICRRMFYKKSSPYNIQNRYETGRDDFDISLIDSYTEYNDEIYEKFAIEDSQDDLQIINNNKRNEIIKWIDANLGWYDIELFKMYYKIGDYNPHNGYKRDKECDKEVSSFRKMQKRTQINYLSIQASVSNTISLLKQNFNNNII